MHSFDDSQDNSESDILQILLQLSDIGPPEWEPPYPFLDPTTVSRVSQSSSYILHKGKPTLKRQLLLTLRKWCTGRSKSQDAEHGSWVGRSITVQNSIKCVLSVSIHVLKDVEDWSKRDPEQQLAFCYAILGAATSSSGPLHPEAGDMCAILAERVLNRKELDLQHHRFLAQVWSSVGELPQLLKKTDVLICMAERSFLGIERTLLWLGRRVLKGNDQIVAESFQTVVGSTLLEICSQSPLVFQNACDLFTHMMAVSDAHPGVQTLIKLFISGVEVECAKRKEDICTLYDESCQILSALLCLDPSLLPDHGEHTLSRETILQMLHKLPRKKAACLLSHRPIWLLYTI